MLESDDQKYVNAIHFYEAPTAQEEERGQTGAMLGWIQGADPNGTWHRYDLDETTQILGVHGSLNSAPNIRALGFVVWTIPDEYKKAVKENALASATEEMASEQA